MQGPHRARKRGGGASVVQPTVDFGRRAKAEPTTLGCQGMDLQNASSGVHARPGRLLTPRARVGGPLVHPRTVASAPFGADAAV
jgi:hypothetical protein